MAKNESHDENIRSTNQQRIEVLLIARSGNRTEFLHEKRNGEKVT